MKYKRILACALIAALVVVLAGIGPAGVWGTDPLAPDSGPGPDAGKTENIKGYRGAEGSKDEVVYVILDPQGAAKSVYVINHFEAAEGDRITDYGDYSSVQNLTDTGELAQNGDAVTFSAGSEDFYYQGNMRTADIPWIFDISWYLDGRRTAPGDMAGRDGRMELRISSRQNPKADQTFYDNYMLQLTLALDTERCKNIDAPRAVIAEAGKDKAVTYTVMPGSDADYILTADVCDFVMDGIQISGIPFSMEFDIPDTDGQIDDLNKLPDAISELNDGVGELLDGTKELGSGAGKLADGSADIRQGLSLLGRNSGQLKSASVKIRDALAQISGSLSDGSVGDIDPGLVLQLPAALRGLAAGLGGVSDGLGQLKNGFSQSYAALDGAMNAIPQGTLTQAEIEAFLGSVPAEQQAAASELAENYLAAQAAKGTYGAVKDGFAATPGAMDTFASSLAGMALSLGGMAAGIEDMAGSLGGLEQLGGLVSGLRQLSENYSEFHKGLVSYADGVSALAANYSDFHEGLVEFGDGVAELNDGVGELYDGTKTLSRETAGLPDDLKKEIDKMKEQYLPADFDAVSFTSPKNKNTVYVQFVMRSEDIEKPEQVKETPAETRSETLWDRLTALFTGGNA